MDRSYKSVKESEDCVLGFVRFIRRAGLAWIMEPYINLPYAVFAPGYSVLGVAHLVYSLTHFTHSLGDMAIIVHFSLLCSTAVLVNLTMFFQRKTFYYVITDACRSYDYGGEIMQKIQSDFLLIKNKKFIKISHYQIIMHVCLLGNLIVTSLIDKFILGQEYFSLYPSGFPSFVPKDLIAVNLLIYGLEVLALTIAGFTVFTAFGTTHFVYTHLTSEFILFCRALDLLQERAAEMAGMGVALHIAYRRAVRGCSEHHRYILEYFKKIQPVTQIMYTLIQFYGLMLLICTGVVMNSNNLIAIMKFVGITLIELFFLFTVSWFSEEVAEKGRVANATVYNIDWFAVPPDCRTTLRILLVGSQRPLMMKTYFGQVINLDSYMGMLKAAYSYFNMVLLY